MVAAPAGTRIELRWRGIYTSKWYHTHNIVPTTYLLHSYINMYMTYIHTYIHTCNIHTYIHTTYMVHIIIPSTLYRRYEVQGFRSHSLLFITTCTSIWRIEESHMLLHAAKHCRAHLPALLSLSLSLSISLSLSLCLSLSLSQSKITIVGESIARTIVSSSMELLHCSPESKLTK